MLLSLVETADIVDFRIFDGLIIEDSEEALALKSFLNSLEMLAWHWNLIKKEKYGYRH
jgi:hypothetical protein